MTKWPKLKPCECRQWTLEWETGYKTFPKIVTKSVNWANLKLLGLSKM